MTQLTRELRRGTTVGLATGLQGAGGFGKTTLAHMAAEDRRLLRHFAGRIAWVTLGRDRQGAAILGKVHDAIRQIAPDEATANTIVARSTGVNVAGRELGLLLDSQPRWLLILDDVWEADQLEPFAVGGKRGVRLVTTRNRGLLRGKGTNIVVDQMTESQARQVLVSGLPEMPPETVTSLLSVTGRWPLLLGLVNKILADAYDTGADLAATARDLHLRLREEGPAIVDPISGVSADSIDLDDPRQRSSAVEATMRASLDLLTSSDARRVEELAVMAEDETLPVALVAGFWRRTAGLEELDARQICVRLAKLGLVGLDPADGGQVSMHDVIRDYLRAKVGDAELVRLNRVFLDAAGANLPPRGRELA
jgi:hypothetical protein